VNHSKRENKRKLKSNQLSGPSRLPAQLVLMRVMCAPLPERQPQSASSLRQLARWCVLLGPVLVPPGPTPIVFHASSRRRRLCRAARSIPHRRRHLGSIVIVRIGSPASARVCSADLWVVRCGRSRVRPVPFAVTPTDAFAGEALVIAVHAEETSGIRRRRDRCHVVAVGADAVRAGATVPL
jgi:hypothetical protein